MHVRNFLFLDNFCVSGNAVDWYWTRNSSCYQPYQRLVCKNWGSVVGGSFLNAFFEVPTLLIELVVCHPNTCCSKIGTFCYNICNIFTCFFELVRTDAYSYINLTGIPFCDAARQCAKLCDRSAQFVGYHSAMKHYRLAAHIASVCFVFFWAFWILNYRTFNFDLWNVAIVILAIYGTVTWFIGIHADSAEGLQTSYLAELELEGEHQYMQKILPSMRKILQPLQNRVQGDGNC